MKNTRLIFTLLLTNLIATPSFALGKFGHKIICQLSYQQLSNTEQNKIMKILANIPRAEQQRINRYNHQKLNKKISFADSCTWADAIKQSAQYHQYKSWHYRNVKRNQLKITKLACNTPCLTSAISFHQQQLSNRQGWQQSQALMFLGHWLGDIHQPLHISFADDRGGNNIKLTQQKCHNLHWFWDECLLTQQDKKLPIWVKMLSQQWQQAPITKWQQSSIIDWANESLALITSTEFNYCRLDKNNNCQPLAKKHHKLTADYIKQYAPILQQQLLKAAVRLTASLKQYL